MTKSEREELRKLIRTHERLAKSVAEQRAAELLADAEQQLAARYDFGDQAWADLTDAAATALRDADEQLARRCQALGIPAEFRPHICFEWFGRGENACAQRRAELRRVAQRRIEALKRQALVAVETKLLDVTTRLTVSALESEEARAFFAAMPTIEHLMPRLKVEDLGPLAVPAERAE